MRACILIFLAACLAVSMAAPYWGYPYAGYGAYGDENNDRVPDVYDHNRDGKVDGYYGYYGQGYGYPRLGYNW